MLASRPCPNLLDPCVRGILRAPDVKFPDLGNNAHGKWLSPVWRLEFIGNSRRNADVSAASLKEISQTQK
jgi:hypothetical protein